MPEQEFEKYLQKWEPLLAKINTRIALREMPEIDIMDPDWLTKMAQVPTLMQSDKNFGAEFNALTTEIAEVYLTSAPQQCEKIRQVLSKYESVLHFLGISVPLERIKSKEDLPLFRQMLAFESIRDQGHDTRDLLVSLGEIYKCGKDAGIDVVSCVKEIQKISSSVDKFGWGSMQAILGGQSGTSPVKESPSRS